MINFDLKTITQILICIDFYKTLGNYFTQLDPKQITTLNEYHEQMLKFSRDGKNIDYDYLLHWNDFNLNVIKQSWGNTSGGWEGIGGSAMTDSYTVIIENNYTGAIFVFYGGKLAYIAKDNEELKKYKSVGFINLPGIKSAKSNLELFYRSK